MDKLRKLLFQNISPKQTIAKNFFWLIATQGSRIFRSLVTIYAARILGTEGYGLFSYVFGLAGIMLFFADPGIGELITRDVAKHKDRRTEYFSAGFWLRIFSFSLSALVFLIAVPYASKIHPARIFIYLAILYAVFENLRRLVLSYVRGLERMELEAVITATANIAVTVPGLFILSGHPNVQGLFWVYIISAVISFLAATILAGKILIRNVFSSFKISTAMELLQNCWPIAIFGMLGLMAGIDVIILGWWRTSSEIGIYSAVQRITQLLFNLPVILASAIFPTLSAIVHAGNREHEKKLNEKTLAIIFLFVLPIISGGIILNGQIISFIFGADFLPGVSTFRILLLGLIFTFPAAIISNIVLAHNRQQKIVKYVSVSFGLNILLDIILIPQFGIAGAAIASLTAQGVNCILIWREIKKFSYFETLPHLKKIIISSAIMTIASLELYELSVGLFLNIIISGIVYLGILILLKEEILYILTKLLSSNQEETIV